VATMIERDDHIPPLAELVAELDHARSVAADAHAHARAPALSHTPARTLPRSAANFDRSLSEIQHAWTADVLAPALPEPQADLAPGHRFDVYYNAYSARLCEALADTFEKTERYMGSDLFERHATEFTRSHPPTSTALRDFGAEFPAVLQETYPDNPELWELAQLDWDLRQSFDALDNAPLTHAMLALDPAQQWLSQASPLVPHAKQRAISRNVPAIWSAIHADEDVPAPVELPSGTTLLTWRKGHQPHFQTLGPATTPLVAAMLAGASIAQACEQHAELIAEQPADFLSNCLAQWLEEEILRAV
jgi:hypothetical protein